MTRTFTILFVCSGNICRSPLAAQLFADRLGAVIPHFDITSAGTVATPGAPFDPEAAHELARLGVDPQPRAAAPLTAASIAAADLVLTAERAHRAAVVAELPRASSRVFTIRQFARILAGLEAQGLSDAEGPVGLVETGSRLRGTVPQPADPNGDDVPDPYRRGPEAQRVSADQIAEAVEVIARAFRRVLVDEVMER